jgi:phenylalanyl-tRNA synthetase beta chain
VNLLPSFARCASMAGLAREIAAITGKPFRMPNLAALPLKSATEYVELEISEPANNPRFMAGLLRNVTIGASPALVQRRLREVGMRPINNVVDATNYAMIALGQPLHAFDYDVLVKRAKVKKVKIITRAAKPGETLTTLDGVERKLDSATTLVCDTAGALSIAGVMGGAESEVTPETKNILLESAAWNMINIRRTARGQNLPSEASYRYSRGVHPSMAEKGLLLALELMKEWSGASVAPEIADQYPLPPKPAVVEITEKDVKRWLGINIAPATIAELLSRLEFRVKVEGEKITVTAPDHRLDIGEAVAGKADVIEEVARIYGYGNIPEERMADGLPPQRGNPILVSEERIRDILVSLGAQEVISYRWSTPERENRRLSPDAEKDTLPYVKLKNPLAYEKAFLRHSVLASVLDIAERNSRVREHLAFFEIGPVFLTGEEGDLPDEKKRLALVLAGKRALPGWQPADSAAMDFYDLKGVVTALLEGLRLPEVSLETVTHPSFHPGKCARVMVQGQQVGVMGELHPKVRAQYDWASNFKAPALAADLDLDMLIGLIPALYQTENVPTFPPVIEDLAFILGEGITAEKVEGLIRQTGGKMVNAVRLFDVFRSEQIGAGKKSLAYQLTYQAADRTLTDTEVAATRNKIIKRLEHELNAKLRSV